MPYANVKIVLLLVMVHLDQWNVKLNEARKMLA
jgi:hypothetical protein